MTSLLPRLTAVLVGAAVVLVPSAALAAGPGEAPSVRAAQAGPAVRAEPSALPSVAAAAAARAGATGAAAGAATGAAAGRSAVQGPGARSEGAAAPAGRAAAGAPDKAAEAAARPAKAAAAKAAARPVKPEPAEAAAKPVTPKPAKAAAPKPARAVKAEPARRAAPVSKPPVPAQVPSDDPRGNNGTFKVDGPALDTSHGNEPQVDCAFRLNFYGYDAGQLANIVFTPIAPTAGPSTTVSGRQLISADAARGGLYNGSYPVTGTWTAADLGLDPTVRQHVKVSVESLNADGSNVPGGAKHKVFWLHPCVATAATAAVPVSAAGLPHAPVLGPQIITGGPAAQPATAPAPVAVPVMGPHTQVLGAAATAVQAVTAQAVTAQGVAPARVVSVTAAPLGAAAVTASQLRPPAALPFTGSPQLLALLVGGLIALLGGTALVVATRTSA